MTCLGWALELKVTGRVNHCLECFCARSFLALKKLVCSCSKTAAQQFPARLCGRVICSRNWVITSHCYRDFFTFFSGAAPFRAGLFKHSFSGPFKQVQTLPLVISGLVWNVKAYHSLNSHISPKGCRPGICFHRAGHRGWSEGVGAGTWLFLICPFWEPAELVLEHAFHGQSWWLWMECCPVTEPGGKGLEWKHWKQQGQHCPRVGDYQLQCGSPVDTVPPENNIGSGPSFSLPECFSTLPYF